MCNECAMGYPHVRLLITISILSLRYASNRSQSEPSPMSLSFDGLPYSAGAQFHHSSLIGQAPPNTHAWRWSSAPTPQVTPQALLPDMLQQARLGTMRFNEYGPFHQYPWGPSLRLEENVYSESQSSYPLTMVHGNQNTASFPAVTSFAGDLSHCSALPQLSSQDKSLDSPSSAPILPSDYDPWRRRAPFNTIRPHHRPDH